MNRKLAMNQVSPSKSKPWSVEQFRATSLQVMLLKRTWVFPWGQFLYAEGANDEVRAAFSTHDVVVKGSGLTSLLQDLAMQQVSLIREPARADAFGAGSSGITSKPAIRDHLKTGQRN
jgi:hypothetical protein